MERNLFVTIFALVLGVDLIIFFIGMSRFGIRSGLDVTDNCEEATVVLRTLEKIDNARVKKCTTPVSPPTSGPAKCPEEEYLITDNPKVIGTPRQNKAFLGVGVVGKGREFRAEAIIKTVSTLLRSYQSSSDRMDMLVVVVVGSVFQDKRTVVQRVQENFNNEIQQGLVQILIPPQDYYTNINTSTPSHGWSRKNCDHAFTEWNSRLSLDIAYTYRYLHTRSLFAWTITADIIAKPSLFKVMSNAFEQSKTFNVTKHKKDWWAIHVSSPGYLIGKAFRAPLVLQIVRYLEIFHRWQSPGEIMGSIVFHRHSKHVIHHTQLIPYLFPIKHPSDNPPVTIISRLDVLGNCDLLQAYNRTGAFAMAPSKEGEIFHLEFRNASRLKRVVIVTGSPTFQDIIESAHVDVSTGLTNEPKGNVTIERRCTDVPYKELGDFQNGEFRIDNLQTIINEPIKCLRVVMRRKQKNWLQIRDIAVWKA